MWDLGNILNQIIFNNSGSTCISILTYGKKIFVANVGDSRAIIARIFNECKF